MNDSVEVFNYESYIASEDKMINHDRYATMEYINKCNLIAITAKKLVVSKSDLDTQGRYIPKDDKSL